ncbi:MAG: hypothetical protein JNL01_08440 [Bdellovibrionales bacterium]|nr:hypothetical protein [Bdellovibrionales bacterium]
MRIKLAWVGIVASLGASLAPITGKPVTAFAQDAAPATGATAAPVAEPVDPRTTKSLFKIFVRSEERGGRFIQLGEGGETLPATELASILSLSKDEEVQKEMKNFDFWAKMNRGATIFTVATGATAFTLWGMSVANNESGSGAAMAAFGVSAIGVVLMQWTNSKSSHFLYRAQQIHNGKLIDRKKDPAPSTSSLSPQGIGSPLSLSLRWEF